MGLQQGASLVSRVPCDRVRTTTLAIFPAQEVSSRLRVHVVGDDLVEIAVVLIVVLNKNWLMDVVIFDSGHDNGPVLIIGRVGISKRHKLGFTDGLLCLAYRFRLAFATSWWARPKSPPRSSLQICRGVDRQHQHLDDAAGSPHQSETCRRTF
jgi:hypothetical protein